MIKTKQKLKKHKVKYISSIQKLIELYQNYVHD